MYRLFETDEFIKSLEKLAKRDQQFIEKKLLSYVYPQLKVEPHFGKNIKKLRNYRPETWRYRIENFRIFYTIDENDNLVLLLVAERRSNAYKK